MRISDIMTEGVISIGHDEPVTAAARLLKQHNIGALPVCDMVGNLRGILTDRDIVLRCIAPGYDAGSTQVSEVMTHGVVTASPDDSVENASKLMARDQIRRLPVTDNGKLVGIVALADLARNAGCEMEAADALSEISENIKRK